MDTVSNLPFDAYLIANPSQYSQRVLFKNWYKSNASVIIPEDIATIEENDELDLVFSTVHSNARLYFDALECCPVTERIHVDDFGLVYCTPADLPISLYRSTSEYDALRVDTLQLTVDVDGEQYISFLQIKPKQLAYSEWLMMRNDLENEITGLSQDLVRHNIGLGNEVVGVIPPDELYSFFVINKNASSITSALLDLATRPKYEVEKRYEKVSGYKHGEIDAVSVRHYLRKGYQSNTMLVPAKEEVYDIQENRLLKKMILDYDKKIKEFLRVINNSLEYHQQCIEQDLHQTIYEKKYIEGLLKYKETAIKLKKLTAIIKSADWFKEIKLPSDVYIPHSFAKDSRYGTLYRVFCEINKNTFKVQLHTQYSYAWKKSSSLYEMWCYICVCRYLINNYTAVSSNLSSVYAPDQVFPFLISGTKVSVEDDDSIVDVFYDVTLPRKSSDAQMRACPLYMTGATGNHYRPDICINVYSKKSGWYVGSIIIECKYRKISSFWYGNTWSSKKQIITYHNDSKSPFFCGGHRLFRAIRPVQSVMVFTPDITSPREVFDNCVICTFKPSEDNTCVNTCCESIMNQIKEYISNADEFYDQIHN